MNQPNLLPRGCSRHVHRADIPTPIPSLASQYRSIDRTNSLETRITKFNSSVSPRVLYLTIIPTSGADRGARQSPDYANLASRTTIKRLRMDWGRWIFRHILHETGRISSTEAFSRLSGSGQRFHDSRFSQLPAPPSTGCRTPQPSITQQPRNPAGSTTEHGRTQPAVVVSACAVVSCIHH